MVALLHSAYGNDVSSNEAAAALHNIRTALNEYRSISIQDAQGQDLTKYFVKPRDTFFAGMPHQQRRAGLTSVSAARAPYVSGTLHVVARNNSDPDRRASGNDFRLINRDRPPLWSSLNSEELFAALQHTPEAPGDR